MTASLIHWLLLAAAYKQRRTAQACSAEKHQALQADHPPEDHESHDAAGDLDDHLAHSIRALKPALLHLFGLPRCPLTLLWVLGLLLEWAAPAQPSITAQH